MASNNPYSAPHSGISNAPPHDGFNVRLGTRFPPICLKCARRDGVGWRTQQLTWFPPIAFPFAYAPFIRMIASYFAEHAVLHLPLCGGCDDRWRATSWVTWIHYALILLFLAAVGVGRAIDDSLLTVMLGTVTMLFAILIPTGLELLYVRRASIWAKAIDRLTVTLGGVHPDARSAIEEEWAAAWLAAEARLRAEAV